LDTSVASDTYTVLALEAALEGLIEVVPVPKLEPHLATSYAQTSDIQFLYDMISRVPPSTPRKGVWRRRLALAAFFGDARYLTRPTYGHNTRTGTFVAVQAHITSNPAIFDIRPRTDFVRLKTMIQLLDIGLDTGDPPLSSDLSPVIDPASIRSLDQNKEASPPRPDCSTYKGETELYDATVDKLAETVKMMHSNIVDTGTSHASRTEAKDVLEQLQARLVFAVRTKRRPRKDLWGEIVRDKDEESFGGRGKGSVLMAKFLSRKGKEEGI